MRGAYQWGPLIGQGRHACQLMQGTALLLLLLLFCQPGWSCSTATAPELRLGTKDQHLQSIEVLPRVFAGRSELDHEISLAALVRSAVHPIPIATATRLLA